jgi:hypothetical protein
MPVLSHSKRLVVTLKFKIVTCNNEQIEYATILLHFQSDCLKIHVAFLDWKLLFENPQPLHHHL